MSFANKVVLVIGASSGIGAATAILFAKEGANVALVGRKEDKLNNVFKKCAEFNRKHLLIKADVSKDDDVKRIIKDTIDNFGKLDILINNAGIVRFAKIEDNNLMEVYDEVVNTNLRALVHLTHLATPYLIQSKGNIVNVSSIAATIPPPVADMISYGLSKAGLNYFTRGAAAELAPYGVRINTVSPGPVRTDILVNANRDANDIEQYVTPLGRISDSEEIADLILYLASDKAKAITGSDFVSDNGFLLKR